MGRKMRKWKIVCEGEHLIAVVFGVGGWWAGGLRAGGVGAGCGVLGS